MSIKQVGVTETNFKSLCCSPATLKYCLKDSKCKQHLSRNKPCIFHIYPTKKQTKIYGAFTNYMVEEYKFFCVDYTCRKWNLLNTKHIISSPTDYIYFIDEHNNKHKILNIGKAYISLDILLKVNNLTIHEINGKAVYKWRKAILVDFLTRAQVALKSKLRKYNIFNLRKYIDKEVISVRYLTFIRDYLWRMSWYPFVGMYCCILFNIVKYFYIFLYTFIHYYI